MKRYMILSGIGAGALVAALLLWSPWAGSKPFQGLRAEEIESVTIELLPPDVSITASREEISRLADLLSQVVVYQKDQSYTEYAGQAVLLTITRTDGSQTAINAFNPFLIIDGAGYRTKYEPCEALNRFANSLREGR